MPNKKILKFKTDKLKEFFKELLNNLGEHSLSTFFKLLLIALFLGVLVFYQYSFLAEREKFEVSFEKPLQFNKGVYQEVLKIWQSKEEKFEKELLIPFSEEIQEVFESETESYIISKGETLWELAEKYLGSGKRWGEIKTETGQIFNKSSAEVIPIGQKLIIPKK